MLDELRAGATAADLGRKHGIPIQNILKWKKSEEQAVFGKTPSSKEEQMVPAVEYRKALDEIRNLRRSLVNMTVDRDILKEAHDIAVKKKWILPGK